jgi:hypothetical protein
MLMDDSAKYFSRSNESKPPSGGFILSVPTQNVPQDLLLIPSGDDMSLALKEKASRFLQRLLYCLVGRAGFELATINSTIKSNSSLPVSI